MKERPESWKKLARLYIELGTIAKAAEACGIVYSTARKRLITMGVELNARGHTKASKRLTGPECREWRERLGLSQEALGAKAKVTGPMISDFERSKINMRETTITKLIEALQSVLRSS